MHNMMQRKQIYDRNVFNCILEVGNEIQAKIVLTQVLRPKMKICSPAIYYGLSNDHRCNSSFIHHLLRPMMSTSFFMPPPLDAGGIMFSGCPSVRPKPEIPSFDLYKGLLVHPTNRNHFTACPSVRPYVRPSVRRGFRAFAGECMEGLAWNFICWCILTIFKTD